uniref:Uncharacterized protein n=1 Tax=viral metagenome TaxID=1070528 RepID=A0A6C0DIC7_9ZZZZ
MNSDDNPKDTEKSVFDKMDISMMEVVQSVRRVHGEYFICGLFLGLAKPNMGWALLGLTISLPTIIILKHPEWLRMFKDEKIEHMLLLMLLIMASDMYALHCFTKSLGFDWPY